MNPIKILCTKTAILAVMLFAIAACDSNDGPLEKAGQSIDQTATDMGNKIEDACEEIKKGVNAQDSNC
tara:strand:- start:5620 stop:5823 length:204 start_codon:yes stop_codon:yes gene_type:complete